MDAILPAATTTRSCTVTVMGRVGVMLCVALPLTALDLYVKASRPTEYWAYHQRSYAWLLLSVSLLAGMILVARIPSLVVAPAAGVLAAGLLGNALSAAWNGMEVPNPLVFESDHALIAFNLADIWAVLGILLLVSTIGIWLIRHRDLFPQRADVRDSGRTVVRRFCDEERP
jgi:hypothetical protein